MSQDNVSRRTLLTGLAGAAVGVAGLTKLATPAFAEPQPHMQAALAALETARNELQAAEHDKAGHRANALRLVNEAIREVHEGMRADRH